MITSGSSKGGMSAFIACAGDKRIAGSYPTAYNSANFPEFTRLKGERWGWHVKPKETGPAGETAAYSLKLFDNPEGQYYRQLFDPVGWGDLLAGKFVMPTVGTNDPLFHLLTDQFYYDELKAKTAILRVPNYGHGRKAPRIAAGWRFAVAAALLGRNVPSIRLTTRESDGQVSVLATVKDAGKIKKITLYTANDQTGDYRKAKWRRIEAAHRNDTGDAVAIAAIEEPANGTLAAVAELVEEGAWTDSIVSSNGVEIGTPVKHRLE
ncbi:MAG: hypothetical protein GY953_24700 [bacterium]|nr:hypothetical protein [bacterium]